MGNPINSKMTDEVQQLACVYASLILGDDGLEITADKLTKVLEAANISVNPFFPSLFSDAMRNRDIAEIAFTGIGGGGGGGGAVAETGAAEAEAPKEEAKAPQPEEESDEEMELDLFG